MTLKTKNADYTIENTSEINHNTVTKTSFWQPGIILQLTVMSTV